MGILKWMISYAVIITIGQLIGIPVYIMFSASTLINMLLWREKEE